MRPTSPSVSKFGPLAPFLFSLSAAAQNTPESTPNGNCTYSIDPTYPHIFWNVFVFQNELGNKKDSVGGGLLDNVRGICGGDDGVMAWTANFTASDLSTSFTTYQGLEPNCTGQGMEAAIAETNGLNLTISCIQTPL